MILGRRDAALWAALAVLCVFAGISESSHAPPPPAPPPVIVHVVPNGAIHMGPQSAPPEADAEANLDALKRLYEELKLGAVEEPPVPR